MAYGIRHLIRIFMLASLMVLCTLAPATAIAWGQLAHRSICAIALMQLDTSERAEIDRLASRFRAPDGRQYRYFTSGCTFADAARAKARDGDSRFKSFTDFNRWHFLNVPRSTHTVLARHCREDCVVHGINRHFREFANHDLAQTRRATAMLMLSHWIGDIHQPMHVSFEDDRGGNRIKVAPGGLYRDTNLHAVWDNGVMEKAMGERDWWDFAQQLNASITDAERREWTASTPLQWAQESYDIAVDPLSGYCKMGTGGTGCLGDTSERHLDTGYQQRVEPIVLEQIRRAGTRLAHFLALGLER
jgi:hypothetical protein